MRILPLALTGLAAVALAACTEGAARTEPARGAEPRAVVAHTVVFAPRTAERTLVGTVRPRIESDLGFRVAGKLAERLVVQGERVVAGQPLARLDPTDLALQRDQAAAELEAATVGLAASEAQDRRTEELRRNGWATQATLDQQLARTADARGRLERARRALDLATNQAGYAVLTADVDGVVTATLAEPGQVVGIGAPVVRIARGAEREAVVAVPEALLERVRTGTATVSLWSAPDRRYEARLREVAAAADPATRTFQARFSILAPDPGVAIGMTATVAVAAEGAERVARVPVSAVFAEGDGPRLFAIDGATGALTLRPVSIVGYEGRDALIASGVSDGERIVAYGVHKLAPADRVRVVDVRR